MTETFNDKTIVDHIAPAVRLFRASCQFFMAATFVSRAGKTPDDVLTINYGWDTDSSIAEFEQFNNIAQWQIRFAPTLFAGYLWWLATSIPTKEPPLYLWPAVIWIMGQIVLLGVYDPLAGLYEVLKP